MFNNHSDTSSSSGDTRAVAEYAQSQQHVHEAHSPATKPLQRMSLSEHLAMYWKFFFSTGERTPTIPLPLQKVTLSRLLDLDPHQLKTIWLGHSSLLINIEGYSILTDPVFERRLSLVGPANFHSELPLNVNQLSHLDAVIISHDHYDHLNKFSIRQLAKITRRFLVPTGVGARLRQWGIGPEKIIELGWWQEYRLDNKLTLTATPAQHFSGRGLTDRNSTLWSSWVIQGAQHRLFFSGDSGYFSGFREIGQQYGPFDMTFLECGAYNERWPNIHMFPEQTAQAHLDLRGKILHPIHWATFNLSMHPWYEPMERVLSAAWEKGITLATPAVGQLVDCHTHHDVDLWWEPAMERGRIV